MTSKNNLRITAGLLAAGLAFGASVAQAKSGVAVTKGQETAVTVGMSLFEVQQAIGRPAQILKYGNEPGPTWIYEADRGPSGRTEFDVDFGSDGRVASVTEIVRGGGR